MPVQTVYLVRHGETDYNYAHRLQGSMPVPLNDKGRNQATSLGKYLQQYPIDAIFTSPLPRARQTAEHIAQAIPVTLQDDPRLQEISFGKFEGLTYPQIESQYAEAYRMWQSRDMTFTVPDGESRRAVQKRMTSAWHEITSSDYQTVVIVSHGAAIKILLRYLFYHLPNKVTANTSITTLTRYQSVWEMPSFAETPHLND